MNKSFKKYGKASFQSRLPRRDKQRRKARAAMAVASIAIGLAQVKAIQSVSIFGGEISKAAKAAAITNCMINSLSAAVATVRVKA